jgi:excisionase family DNA binding protein
MEAFVGYKKLSESLGLGPQTVWLWAKRGLIPSYKVGRVRLFKMSEIEECLRAYRVGLVKK